MSEFAAIDAIRESLPGPTHAGEVWIGDDAAVLPRPDGDVFLLAVDTVVAGVHADLDLTGLADFGWKAMAASISDIAAMGADPGYALVSVAGPAGTNLNELYRGIAGAAEAFGCPVVGGDLANATDLVVSVTVSGSCPGSPVLRRGARPGDDVWGTGPLGASAAGLRLLRQGTTRSSALIAAHTRPVPRVAQGRAARLVGATAMIDVSDGFAADLGHISDSSGVGVELNEVPVAEGASLDEALHGGEDFELVFCTPPNADVVAGFSGFPRPVRIGVCTERPGLRLRDEALPPLGWQHQW